MSECGDPENLSDHHPPGASGSYNDCAQQNQAERAKALKIKD
jgi:hypothetical protein